ncbi:MAG: response regulator transcription factor [Melioribacteraceae bacterium]|nr:response regulator transcription factor [Melioribacteraceae bacterium]MCF8432114.1 response regulator transcription factor [Melioribacteraceae bacterium]
MNERVRIIIADDHPMFRAGVRIELEKIENLEIIGETGNGKDALKLIKEHSPDVAILDFQMPEMNGLEITAQLKKEKNTVKIILLTMHNEKRIFQKAINIGVDGYILKEDAVLDIVSAVKTVIDGGTFFSSKLTVYLIDKFKSTQKDKNGEMINELSRTEREILKLISELNSNDEISEKLFISKRTVENQRVIISKKLNLTGAKELLKFSVKYREYL